jgi:hypothetical protein
LNSIQYLELELQNFDDKVGPVEYTHARRKNDVTITIPFEDKVLFVSVEPNADNDKTTRKDSDS